MKNGMTSSVSRIKRAQKESLFYRTISDLFMRASLDDKDLAGLMVSSARLSAHKGMCFVYFYSEKGQAHFDEMFDKLKLYKPSLRAALASTINQQRTPDLTFEYDTQLSKQVKLERLIDHVVDKDNSLLNEE